MSNTNTFISYISTYELKKLLPLSTNISNIVWNTLIHWEVRHKLYQYAFDTNNIDMLKYMFLNNKISYHHIVSFAASLNTSEYLEFIHKYIDLNEYKAYIQWGIKMAKTSDTYDYLNKINVDIYPNDLISVFQSCQYGKLYILEHCHKKGFNLDKFLETENGLLYNLAKYGHIDIAKYLQENGINIIIQNETFDIMKPAIISKKIDIVKYLYENGALITKQALLHLSNSTIEIINYLLENGAQLFEEIIDYKLYECDQYISIYLHEKGVPITDRLIDFSISYGYIDLIKYYHEKGKNVINRHSSIVTLTKYKSRMVLNITKYLYELGHNVENDILKCQFMEYDYIVFLNEIGIDFSKHYQLMESACYYNKIKIIMYLYSNGSNFTPNGLLSVINSGWFDTFVCLHEHGANIYTTEKYNGYTAPVLAAMHGNIDILSYLYYHGVDISECRKYHTRYRYNSCILNFLRSKSII
jgi:ankyrin repeat protein